MVYAIEAASCGYIGAIEAKVQPPGLPLYIDKSCDILYLQSLLMPGVYKQRFLSQSIANFIGLLL